MWTIIPENGVFSTIFLNIQINSCFCFDLKNNSNTYPCYDFTEFMLEFVYEHEIW